MPKKKTCALCNQEISKLQSFTILGPSRLLAHIGCVNRKRQIVKEGDTVLQMHDQHGGLTLTAVAHKEGM